MDSRLHFRLFAPTCEACLRSGNARCRDSSLLPSAADRRSRPASPLECALTTKHRVLQGFGRNHPRVSALECALAKAAPGNSFHEKADPCQEFFALSRFLPFSPSCQAASVATLPSALFWERGSLGASWVF